MRNFHKVSQSFKGRVGLAPFHKIYSGTIDSKRGLLNMHVVHGNFKKCFAINCIFLISLFK